MAVLRPEHAPLTLTDIDRRCRLLAEAGVDDVLRDPVLPRDRGLDPRGVHRPGPRRRPARGPRGGGRELPVRRRAAGDVATLVEAGARPRTSRSRGSPWTADPRCGPRRTCAPAWPPATSRAPRRRWAGLRRGRPRRRGATCGVASSATRRPTCRPVAPPPPRTGCTPDGCASSTSRDASRCPRRSASAPTRPSTASANAGWRPTCSTAPTSTSTTQLVEISFVARIRGMVRFDGVEALVEEMAQDVERPDTLLYAEALARRFWRQDRTPPLAGISAGEPDGGVRRQLDGVVAPARARCR